MHSTAFLYFYCIKGCNADNQSNSAQQTHTAGLLQWTAYLKLTKTYVLFCIYSTLYTCRQSELMIVTCGHYCTILLTGNKIINLY